MTRHLLRACCWLALVAVLWVRHEREQRTSPQRTGTIRG